MTLSKMTKEEFFAMAALEEPAEKSAWISAVALTMLSVSANPDAYPADDIVAIFQSLATRMPTDILAAGTIAMLVNGSDLNPNNVARDDIS